MNTPRLLPLIGVAVAGVLAVKALSGVTALPDLVEGAKAWAEGKAPARTADAGAPAASGSPAAPVLPPGLSPMASSSPAAIAAASTAQPNKVPIACSPSAAELAREGGLSPAELAVLQSLEARRGQLDQREQDMDVQTQLLNAAEAKLDAKLQALAAMKGDIQGLLDKADSQKDAELDRLVTVYSKMKPQAAAQRMALMDDAVRLPIAAKMKEAALSLILAQMAPADAKDITEKLAHRFESKALADAKAAIAPPASSAPAAPATAAASGAQPPAAAPAQAANAQPDAAPAKPKRLARAHKPKPKASDVAANAASPPASKPPASTPAAPASSTPAAAAPAKSG